MEAHDQVTALAGRTATHAALDNPYAVTELLGALRKMEAHDQVTVLAERAATHTALDNPSARGEAGWVRHCGRVEAHDQVTAFAERLPAAGQFDQFMARSMETQSGSDSGESRTAAQPPHGHWEDLE